MPFRDIVGHRRLVVLLSRAIARGTVPPSLLLAGPRGVGKRRVAAALAQAVNCPAPAWVDEHMPHDACGECPSCRRIARGMHPDVIEVAPGDSGSIKIDGVRDIIDRAAFRPFEGRRRVVVIDDADAMTTDAQSALLKILEEPPSASLFVLVSSLPDALLPTVSSRCPRLRFGRLAPAEVAEVLMRSHGYPEAEAIAVAAESDGSVGRALEAAAADAAEARATAQRWLAQTARGATPPARIELAQSFFPKKAAPAVERERLAACLRALASLLRDLGILLTGADTRTLANADLKADLERLTNAYDSARTTRAFAAVDRALGALERNASPKVVADWLVLEL